MRLFFPETSFLFAAYREQSNSAAADKWLEILPQGTQLSALVLIELRNSFRCHVGWFLRNRKQGFPPGALEKALHDLASDIGAGFWGVAVVDWPQVWALTERLSRQYTRDGLHRGLDLLHVATASYLKAETFLTFDENQAKLARSVGMQTPLQS